MSAHRRAARVALLAQLALFGVVAGGCYLFHSPLPHGADATSDAGMAPSATFDGGAVACNGECVRSTAHLSITRDLVGPASPSIACDARRLEGWLTSARPTPDGQGVVITLAGGGIMRPGSPPPSTTCVITVSGVGENVADDLATFAASGPHLVAGYAEGGVMWLEEGAACLACERCRCQNGHLVLAAYDGPPPSPLDDRLGPMSVAMVLRDPSCSVDDAARGGGSRAWRFRAAFTTSTGAPAAATAYGDVTEGHDVRLTSEMRLATVRLLRANDAWCGGEPRLETPRTIAWVAWEADPRAIGGFSAPAPPAR